MCAEQRLLSRVAMRLELLLQRRLSDLLWTYVLSISVPALPAGWP
jgi:hypothetical protein